MLAGVSTRRFGRVQEPVGEAVEGEARSTSKSAVSREFIARTRENLDALMGRRLDDVRLAVLMIDGVDLKGRTNVVALGITTDGIKIPLGLWKEARRTPLSPRRCWPISSLVASMSSRACSASWTVPRRSARRSATCSACTPRSSGACATRNVMRGAVRGQGQPPRRVLRLRGERHAAVRWDRLGDAASALVRAVTPVGLVIDDGWIPADEDGLALLVARLGPEALACVEMMSGAAWVRERLQAAGWIVQIANARKAKAVGSLAAKTDKLDARVLAELARRDLVPQVHVPTFADRELKERLGRRMHLVRLRTSAMNRATA